MYLCLYLCYCNCLLYRSAFTKTLRNVLECALYKTSCFNERPTTENSEYDSEIVATVGQRRALLASLVFWLGFESDDSFAHACPSLSMSLSTYGHVCPPLSNTG